MASAEWRGRALATLWNIGQAWGFDNSGQGMVRGEQPAPFHPATLPAYGSAFAMNVHEAQGSAFDEVWLVLRERHSLVPSQELV